MKYIVVKVGYAVVGGLALTNWALSLNVSYSWFVLGIGMFVMGVWFMPEPK